MSRGNERIKITLIQDTYKETKQKKLLNSAYFIGLRDGSDEKLQYNDPFAQRVDRSMSNG